MHRESVLEAYTLPNRGSPNRGSQESNRDQLEMPVEGGLIETHCSIEEADMDFARQFGLV